MSALRRFVLAVCLAAALAPTSARAALSPGQIDSAFGTAGFVDFEPSQAAPKRSFVNDVAVDPQGRILATGGASDSNGNQAFYVERFLANGAVDTSFGENGTGILLRQLSPNSGPLLIQSSGLSVDPAPDGGVLVGALRWGAGNNTEVLAVKLNSSGHLDLGYGSSGNGTAVASTGSASHLYLSSRSSVVLPDGSLVLTATESPNSSISLMAFVKFGPNGTGNTFADSQLADGGSSNLTSANSIAGLPGGKFLIAGSAGRANGDTDGFVARVTSTGTLDTSYGGPDRQGVSYFQKGDAASNKSTGVQQIVNGPDSSVYALSNAYTGVGGETKATITRLGASGQLDGGFGPGGTRALALHQCAGSGCATRALDLLLDSSSRVIALLGIDEGSDQQQFAVARYRPDGVLDPSFGTDGLSYGPRTGPGMFGMAFAQANRLLLGGSRGGSATYNAVLSRLSLERVDDPVPPPPVDKTAPKLTKLKITASTKTRHATLAYTSTEAGNLTVRVQRPHRGRRTSKGTCTTRLKKGRRCTLYRTYRTLKLTLLAGKRTTALGRRSYPIGSYRALIAATDKAGNRAKAITIHFKVKAPHKPKVKR